VRPNKKRQRNVKKACEFLRDSMAGFARDDRYTENADGDILDNMLYSVGVALWGKTHMWAKGYEKTLDEVERHIIAYRREHT